MYYNEGRMSLRAERVAAAPYVYRKVRRCGSYCPTGLIYR